MSDREKAAERVYSECFWGDYLLTPETILKKLDNNEPGFDKFLFSKIIENSSYPSRHLKMIFTPEQLKTLLSRYAGSKREDKRFRLITANITGKRELVPEYQWKM